MKKNISINISGIIFHIEEDGYDALKKYLDSINRYFSTFEDSSEILADIESRIAEIFLSRLNEGKQVITQEDVTALVATMGSVRDFQAAEEQESAAGQTQETPRSEYRSQQEKSYVPPQQKKFLRDQKRKILGGVCAGLGNYFDVDPVWIRLLFAFLTLAYGVILLVYVVLWIAIPGSFDLDEPQIDKKLFRNPDKKVLGGVAGGVSAYFNIDVAVVRLIFIILTFFGGLGFFAYIVLWIVLPEARSITDKMQMQGEPVTLSNIETNIKKNLDVKEGEEESMLVKIILFPFRAIAWVLNNLAKILSPVAEVIRVGIGILITVVGLSLVVAVVAAGGVVFGIMATSSGWYSFDEISLPMEAIKQLVPGFTIFMAFVGGVIPGLIIVLLGVSVIAKRIIFNAATGWTLFILFFLSIAVLSISIPKIALGFKEHGEYKTEQVFESSAKTLVLKLHETGMDDYDAVTLTLEGYEGDYAKLVQVFESKGKTKKDAIENAQLVTYSVDQNDSLLTFDSNVAFKEDAIFRAQKLKLTLYLPYNKPFIMEDDFYQLLNQYIEPDNRSGKTWMINDNRRLECLDCPAPSIEELDEWDIKTGEDWEEERSSGTLIDFKEVEISGIFDLTIRQGNRYSVELTGPSAEKDKYRISRLGKTLVIEYDDGGKFDWNRNPIRMDEVRIAITMPELDKLELSGAGKASIRDFTEDEMRIKMLGAIKAKGKINARDLALYLSGASELALEGEGSALDAKVLGASKLNAYDYRAKNGLVEANGASKANVNITGRLEIIESLASKVSYKGNPSEVIKD
jgi:phage shock protein PspC (stress-responsive transcriptional regulator)